MAARKRPPAGGTPDKPLRIEHWPLARFKPYAKNPRKNDAVVDRMVGSIKEFGFRIPIVARSDGEVIDGHLRLKAAVAMGLKEAPVILADDLTPAQVRAFRLLANKSVSWAEWDTGMLATELGDLGSLGFDLTLTGFDATELGDLGIAGFGAEREAKAEETPPVPNAPLVKRGELWRLGPHRLLCGDGTDAAALTRLLDGRVPDIANCDPPYGIKAVKGSSVGGAKPFGKVGGGGMTRFGREHGRAKNAIIQPGIYEEIIGDDTTETALKIYKVLFDLHVPVIVLWGGNYFANAIPPSRCWLVWDKETNGNFADAELAWTNQDRVVELLRHQWSGLIKASERGQRRIHPTQKPAALARWVQKTLAPKAKTVLDPCLGSGSVLIAAEESGIACFGCEMSPAYVHLVILRWQTFTGKIATREDGTTLEDLKDGKTARRALKRLKSGKDKLVPVPAGG